MARTRRLLEAKPNALTHSYSDLGGYESYARPNPSIPDPWDEKQVPVYCPVKRTEAEDMLERIRASLEARRNLHELIRRNI